jgi:hypothetical protein
LPGSEKILTYFNSNFSRFSGTSQGDSNLQNKIDVRSQNNDGSRFIREEIKKKLQPMPSLVYLYFDSLGNIIQPSSSFDIARFSSPFLNDQHIRDKARNIAEQNTGIISNDKVYFSNSSFTKPELISSKITTVYVYRRTITDKKYFLDYNGLLNYIADLIKDNII